MAEARLNIGVSADAKSASATFKELAADIKTVGKESVGVTEGVAKVDAAFAKLAKAPDSVGALASATAKAKLAVADLRAELEKTPATAENYTKIAAALNQAEAAMAGTIKRAGELKNAQGDVNREIDLSAGLARQAIGQFGQLGDVLEKVGASGGKTAGRMAQLGLKVAAVAGAFKVGWDTGTKFNKFLQEHGNYLEKAIDATVRFTAARRDAENTGLAADIDLESAALTEHTKSLLGNIVARKAARNATEQADAAVKAALPGWKSAAEQQKELNATIEGAARKFADLQKNGADWRKEIEANQEPLAKLAENLAAQKVALDTLPEPLRQAIEYLNQLTAAAEGVGGAVSGLEKLKTAIDAIGSAGTGESIKSVAEALASIRAEGGNIGEAFAKNSESFTALRDSAKDSYDTLDAFRKQIMDQIPAYQASAMVNEDYVGALDKMNDAYARLEQSRRAANDADIEASIQMGRMREEAIKTAYAVDTIGEAWQRATGQAAGFTVEVRTATKAVEESNPQFDVMIEELAKVSDEYGRMVPWMGALIAQLEKGTISAEEFLVQVDAMNRGFIQIQGMSGNMFGDIGSEVARLTKIINDFVGGERKRTRDNTTRDWRKKR
ncbi:MAG: hypothetical protein ACYC4P_11635 [Thermoanaerobaculia bacterium]